MEMKQGRAEENSQTKDTKKTIKESKPETMPHVGMDVGMDKTLSLATEVSGGKEHWGGICMGKGPLAQGHQRRPRRATRQPG